MLFRSFVSAATFLTSVPLGGSVALKTNEISYSRAFYPLVGLLIGLLLLVLEKVAGFFVPDLVNAGILLFSLLIITRGLHLDGFMDVCDGMFGAFTKERRLEIMRDPHVGSFAVVGCICLLILKFTLLVSLCGMPQSDKLCVLLISFFFSIFIYRFIFLTPYQYSYINFSYFKIKDSINKFEHDYWGTSFKELVEKTKTMYPQSEINKFKIAVCGGGKNALLVYLHKNLKIKKIYKPDQATHIIMTNRASFNINDKVTCFNKYEGDDLVSVSRNKLVFSVLRKMKKVN